MSTEYHSERNDMNLFKKLSQKNIEINDLNKEIEKLKLVIEDLESHNHLDKDEDFELKAQNEDLLFENEKLKENISELKILLKKNKSKRDNTPIQNSNKNSYTHLYSKRTIQKTESSILKNELKDQQELTKNLLENVELIKIEKNELLNKIDDILKDSKQNLQKLENELKSQIHTQKVTYEDEISNLKSVIHQYQNIDDENEILKTKNEKLSIEANEMKNERNFINNELFIQTEKCELLNQQYLEKDLQIKQLKSEINFFKSLECENCKELESLVNNNELLFNESRIISENQIKMLEREKLKLNTLISSLEEENLSIKNELKTNLIEIQKLLNEKKNIFEDNQSLAQKLFNLEDVLGKKDNILIKKQENMEKIVERFVNNLHSIFKQNFNIANGEFEEVDVNLNDIINKVKNIGPEATKKINIDSNYLDKMKNLKIKKPYLDIELQNDANLHISDKENKEKFIFLNLLHFLISPEKLIKSLHINFKNENIIINHILKNFELFFSDIQKKLLKISRIILKLILNHNMQGKHNDVFLKEIYLSDIYLEKEIRFYFKKCIVLAFKKNIAAKKIAKFIKKRLFEKKRKNFINQKNNNYCLFKVAEGKTMFKELSIQIQKSLDKINHSLNN